MSGRSGFDVGEALDVLERTPRLLTALLGGLSTEWVHATEGVDSWSPARVVGHLIHGEEVDWIPRLRVILEWGESRPFDPFDPEGGPRDGDVDALLARFGALREANLRTVRRQHLSPEGLSRTGTHPALGRVTVAELLATWVVHDLGHVRQIVRVMAKRYAEAVGPWREYLSIVDE